MLIHTLNSTYQLKGAGSFSYDHPQRYDYEVGISIVRAAGLTRKTTIH
ncbi:hypothetical protein [Amphritea japonica]|nr:hypothetical protein [Amphritea japonica]